MYNYDYKNQNTNYNCNRLRWIMYMFKKNCQCKYMDLNYSNNLYSSSLTMFIILFSLQIICTNHHLSYNILIQIKLIALLFCLCVRLCCQIVHALFIGHVKYHIYVACLKQIMKLIHKDWMWEWTHVTPFRTGLLTSSANSTNFNSEPSQNVYHHLSSLFTTYITCVLTINFKFWFNVHCIQCYTNMLYIYYE